MIKKIYSPSDFQANLFTIDRHDKDVEQTVELPLILDAMMPI